MECLLSPSVLRRGTCWLWLLALLLLRDAALAAPNPPSSRDAFSLLARAMRAKLHQTFTGRQEIVFAAEKESGGTRVVADIARAGRRSRMDYRFPASVSDLLVADDGVHERQFHPSCRQYLIRPSSPPEEAVSEDRLALLQRNYRCQLRGRQAIEGRICEIVALEPRFPPAPSRRCWIDRATLAILRTEEYDAVGRRRYVSAFTDIHFAPTLPTALFSPNPPVGASLQEAPPEPGNLPFDQAIMAVGVNGLAPCWVPRGYRLFRCAALPRPHGAHALFLRYGDGLKTLSVFEEALTPVLPPLALQQHMLDDQLGRYGQQAWVQDEGGLRVTVVGDSTLPPTLGAEMMRALAPATCRSLIRALVRDFGSSRQEEAEALRRQGWGYEQIAARLLPHGTVRRREEQARAWVASALH